MTLFRRIRPWGWAALILFGASACRRGDSDQVQGYVEGEYVYVAAPLAGRLQALRVARGAQVKTGDELFVLDDTVEKAALDEAQRRLAAANAHWEDLKKGKRPSEIESLEAQLKQARAALSFSEAELARQEKLKLMPGASTQQEYDLASSARDGDLQKVAQLEADLETAGLGSRTDQIAAAEALVHAREAALVRAEWNFSQKRQSAEQAALVTDTLYREGEWVPAGRAAVVLLPPPNIKVRAFVPETRIGALHAGDAARVSVDGVPRPFDGKISFVSPQAEYTPPVIFSRESRSKLVFMVEIVFAPEDAAKLHPGQPVDVKFNP